jgi:repressor LexA
MPAPLTPKQKRVLDAVRLYVKTRGFPPSVRVLASLTGSAVGTVHQHLQTLQRKGRIAVDGTSHGIRLLSAGGDASVLVEVTITGDFMGDGHFAPHPRPTESIRLPHSVVGARAFAVRIRGDAFSGAHILDRDLLVFQLTSRVRDGDAVFVDRSPTGATLKHARQVGSSLQLLPFHGAGDEATASRQDIRGRLTALLRLRNP